MKHFIFLILLSLLLNSCKKETISDNFDCETTSHFTDSKNYHDVLRKFKVDIPKSWKTELYFDEYQSEIYSADTTKQLSETYIIDLAWHQGELVFDKEFEEKIIENLTEIEHLETVISGFSKFKRRKAYFNLSVGKNTDITYHYLQIYMMYEVDSYYVFNSKIYGDDFVNERICESISLFENIKFTD